MVCEQDSVGIAAGEPVLECSATHEEAKVHEDIIALKMFGDLAK